MKNTIKKTLFIAILMLGAATSFAQLKVSLNMNSHPDPYLSNWPKIKNTVIVTVTNSSKKSVDAKFDCKINLNGALEANTKPESMQILHIAPGVMQFFGEDLVPFEAAKIANGADKTAITTGMLPSGEYEFCVSLIDPQTNAHLTQPVCKNFTLVSYQAPILFEPETKSTLGKTQRLPLFRWSRISPKPPYAVTYRVVVMEILKGQTPVTAFRLNRPILDKNVSATQLMWPSDLDLPKEGMQYIWSVQALDDSGKPIIDQENGFSEPFTFFACCQGDTSGNEGDGIVVHQHGDSLNTATPMNDFHHEAEVKKVGKMDQDSGKNDSTGIQNRNQFLSDTQKIEKLNRLITKTDLKSDRQSSCGKVMIVGIDVEFGDRQAGNNTHGSIADWCNIINTGMLQGGTNGKSDILVIGGGKSSSNDVKNFWNSVAQCLGRNVTYKHRRYIWNSVHEISSVNFNDYGLVVVATSHDDVSGHLTEKELKALNARKDDMAEYLCNCGALFAAACELDNPYGYVSKFGSVAIASQQYNDISPTAEGLSIGITNTNLDNGPWHIAFTSFPSYLKTLALSNLNSIAAIGGKNVSQCIPNFTLQKTTYCIDADIIADANTTIGAVNNFWSIQESDANWNRYGPELTQWFTGPPTTINLTSFAHSKGFNFKCNTYYRIKLAISGLCNTWNETTQLIKIDCPPANAGPDICCTSFSNTVIGGKNFPLPGLSYHWSPSTGLNNPSLANPTLNTSMISGLTPITYILTVADAMGCVNRDTMRVYCGPPIITLTKARVGCCKFKITLQGSEIGNIVWSTGAKDVYSIEVTKPGLYNVWVYNPCGEAAKQIQVTDADIGFQGDIGDIIAPNSFTPDASTNKVFRLIHYGTNAPAIGSGPAYNATDYRLTIFDRWGGAHIVATGNTCTGFINGEIAWDGTINGTPVEQGAYVYMLELKNCRDIDPWPLPKIYGAKFVCDNCGFTLFPPYDCPGFMQGCKHYQLTTELTSANGVGVVTVIR